MLLPKRVKHRKQHRGRMRGMATRGNMLDFGTFGIMAVSCGWVTSRQIEAARIAMTRHIKRGGQVWIRIFPDKPITKKPLEQRMGKGKAPVEGWVAVVKPGRIMFEMAGPTVELAREAMMRAIHKLPVECKFVTKDDFEYGNPLEARKHGWIPEKQAKPKQATWTPGLAADQPDVRPSSATAKDKDDKPGAAAAAEEQPEATEDVPVVDEPVAAEETTVNVEAEAETPEN